jgi:hypothetical protein
MIEQVKIIANFYSALANVFPKAFKNDNPIFFQTTGFGALMRLLPTVFSLTLKNEKGFTIPNVTNTLNKIEYYNFDSWRNFGTGNMAEIQACDDFKGEIDNILHASDESKTSIKL